jgi:hypothetical protein
MTIVWDKISELAYQIEEKIKLSGTAITSLSHEYNWYNSIYTSDRYRRAHIEVVDFRKSHNIYILHTTIFPHSNDPSPIWGFDAVCGPNKITGSFHDFSNAGAPMHPMSQWFKTATAGLSWNKPRQLPPWAQAIFSENMIAAGNISEVLELDSLCNIALTSLDYYLVNVGNTQESGADFHMAQNRYCRYQKQNPHVIRSMVAMGIPEDTMKQFVDTILFPEIHYR